MKYSLASDPHQPQKLDETNDRKFGSRLSPTLLFSSLFSESLRGKHFPPVHQERNQWNTRCDDALTHTHTQSWALVTPFITDSIVQSWWIDTCV